MRHEVHVSKLAMYYTRHLECRGRGGGIFGMSIFDNIHVAGPVLDPGFQKRGSFTLKKLNFGQKGRACGRVPTPSGSVPNSLIKMAVPVALSYTRDHILECSDTFA